MEPVAKSAVEPTTVVTGAASWVPSGSAGSEVDLSTDTSLACANKSCKSFGRS